MADDNKRRSEELKFLREKKALDEQVRKLALQFVRDEREALKEKQAAEKKAHENKMFREKTFQKLKENFWPKEMSHAEREAEYYKIFEEGEKKRAESAKKTAKGIENQNLANKIILDAQKKSIKQKKETRSLEKDITKLTESEGGKILINNGILNKQSIKLRNDKIEDAQREKDSLLSKLGQKGIGDDLIRNLEKEINLQNTKIDGINTIGSIQKEILDDFAAGTLDDFMDEDQIRVKVLEALNITREQFEGLGDNLKEVLNDSIGDLSSTTKVLSNEGFRRLYDSVTEIETGFEGVIKKVELLGDALSNKELAIKGLQLGAAALATSFAKDVFEAAKDIRQELGLSVGEAAQVGAKITIAGKAMSVMGGDSAQVAEFAKGISEEFGNLSQFSTATALQFAKISSFTGISGDNAAKLAKSIQTIQGGSLETSLNTIEVFKNLADAEGVSSKLVLEDLASDSELFAKFAKDGGKNLASAAIEARKLGMGISTVAGMAEKLLDFESSIEAQMNAQVLLGRSINLDKARELSLAGDLEGLAKEIKTQVGSQAEFEAMNVVQREALAEAIGTNVADLSKIIAGEQTSAEIEKERAAQKEASLNKSNTLLQAQTVMAAAAGAANLASAIASIGGSFAKIPFGVGIPLGVAAIAGLFSMYKMAKGMAEGGMVGRDGAAVASSDTVPTMLTPGEVVLNAAQQSNVAGAITNNMSVDTSKMESKMDAQIRESKQMNTNTKRLLEQNEFLMNKLIRKQDGMKLANA